MVKTPKQVNARIDQLYRQMSKADLAGNDLKADLLGVSIMELRWTLEDENAEA